MVLQVLNTSEFVNLITKKTVKFFDSCCNFLYLAEDYQKSLQKNTIFWLNSVYFRNNSQKYTYSVWSLKGLFLSYYSFIDLTQMVSQLNSLSLW